MCRVPCAVQVVWGVWKERKVQLGDRARESGAKSGGRVKSAATLGYLIYNTLPSHLAYCTACNWPKPSKAVPGDHILLYLLKYNIPDRTTVSGPKQKQLTATRKYKRRRTWRGLFQLLLTQVAPAGLQEGPAWV